VTIHEKHMQLVDAVNGAKTQLDHDIAERVLRGWREGVKDAGFALDLIRADWEQFDRGHANRPMCCGVFNDWKPCVDDAQRVDKFTEQES